MENIDQDNSSAGILIPRELETQELAKQMPLQGLDPKFAKVFNIWGESSVGKSVFIDQFRDSDVMLNNKVLWLQPTEQEEIDTPQEFISACSKHLKYPQNPEKEEQIKNALSEAQRGKVNPIQSDDSILISRSTTATNKKPYINQAAAASVGRTEFIREDIQVSVGLGENKYDSLAEAFLDCLPLQSLGTDAIIISLRYWDKLSTMVTDWIRDYVIPAASKGPYRRNIIFLTESVDLDNHCREDSRWNEWEEFVCDYRVLPFEMETAVNYLTSNGVAPYKANLLFSESLGYPQRITNSLKEDVPLFAIEEGIDKFSLPTLIPLLTLDEIHLEEAKAIYHSATSRSTLEKAYEKAPHLFEGAKGKSFRLTRNAKLNLCEELTKRGERGIAEINSSLALARLIRSVPNKSDRVKLLLLSPLQWMNTASINATFEKTADNVRAFVQGNEKYFVSKREHYRISERIRNTLSLVESNLRHAQADEISKKAGLLWDKRLEEIVEEKALLSEHLNQAKDEANRLNRKLNETENRIRELEKKGKLDYIPNNEETSAAKHNGRNILVCSLLSITLFGLSNALPNTYNYIAFISGLASLCIGLALIPSWIKYRRLMSAYNGGHDITLEEFLKDRDNLHQNAQNQEARIAQLTKDILHIKHQLDFPFV
ncbi:hypothetical protein MLD52_04845 [Puniceicoccaceae bacterium K14]|nr:hypothetical protein [Puniceicoccaceae bacterium K14]